MKKTIEQYILDYLAIKPQIKEKKIDYVRNDINKLYNVKVSQSSFSLAIAKLEKKGKIEKGVFINNLT